MCFLFNTHIFKLEIFVFSSSPKIQSWICVFNLRTTFPKLFLVFSLKGKCQILKLCVFSLTQNLKSKKNGVSSKPKMFGRMDMFELPSSPTCKKCKYLLSLQNQHFKIRVIWFIIKNKVSKSTICVSVQHQRVVLSKTKI